MWRSVFHLPDVLSHAERNTGVERHFHRGRLCNNARGWGGADGRPEGSQSLPSFELFSHASSSLATTKTRQERDSRSRHFRYLCCCCSSVQDPMKTGYQQDQMAGMENWHTPKSTIQPLSHPAFRRAPGSKNTPAAGAPRAGAPRTAGAPAAAIMADALSRRLSRPLVADLLATAAPAAADGLEDEARRELQDGGFFGGPAPARRSDPGQWRRRRRP